MGDSDDACGIEAEYGCNKRKRKTSDFICECAVREGSLFGATAALEPGSGGSGAWDYPDSYEQYEDSEECDSECTCQYVGVNTHFDDVQYLCQADNVCYNLVDDWCDEEEDFCEIPM